MPFALCYFYLRATHTIHQSVITVYAAAEPALQIMLESLRLADALKYSITFNTLYQLIDSLDYLPVLKLPIQIFLPSPT